MNDYDDYRGKMVKKGLAFQDFIAEKLYGIGIPIMNFCGQKKQFEHGENLLGMEIKNDNNMAKSGNLYIEIAEKAQPRSGPYVPSGIFRSDNSWLFGIGDYFLFYIFSKTELISIYNRRGEFGCREYASPTSKAFLLPRSVADLHFAKKISFGKDGNVTEIVNGVDRYALDLTCREKGSIQEELFT